MPAASLREFLPQVRFAARIAAVDGGVGVFVGVEIVMVQPVDHAVGAHRDSAGHADRAADGIVKPARAKQPVMRRFMREDEQGMLLNSYDQHGQHNPRTWPHYHAERDCECGDADGQAQGNERAQIREFGEGSEFGRRKHAPRVGFADPSARRR
jgi:hypothetical protein